MNPLVISFYTQDTPYEREVQNLINSCKKWSIEYDIQGVASLGTWEKNCAFKPAFIHTKMLEHNRPLLWVDADGVFKQKPNFNDFDKCDFSVRVNEFLPESHESRIVSNAIFVRNTPEVLLIIEEWKELCANEIADKNRILEFWDQMALCSVLSPKKDLKFLPMPLKYSKIFDFDDLFISEEEVIIEHYQASRRLKNQKIENCPSCAT